MLGKLARLLRILGYDVKYYKSLEDDSIVKMARREGRILLTRDVNLHKKALSENVISIFMKEESKIEKLVKLNQEIGIRLDIDTSISRCPKCNTKITPVSKEKVKSRVPVKTLRHFDEFWNCPNCGQVYWRGSHWKDMRRTLDSAKSRSVSP